MIQAIWQILANYGIDITKIAEWFNAELAKLAPMGTEDAGQYLNTIYGVLQQLAPTTTAVSSVTGAA